MVNRRALCTIARYLFGATLRTAGRDQRSNRERQLSDYGGYKCCSLSPEYPNDLATTADHKFERGPTWPKWRSRQQAYWRAYCTDQSAGSVPDFSRLQRSECDARDPVDRRA